MSNSADSDLVESGEERDERREEATRIKKTAGKKTRAAKGTKTKKTKTPRDPNAPKRPVSAYIAFGNSLRNKLKEEGVTKDFKEMTAFISQQWGSLTPEQRQPYNDEYARGKQTYEEAKAKYDASLLASGQDA